MTLPHVTIIIPTVGGRDDALDQVEAAFEAQGFHDRIVVTGFTWGEGINQALRNHDVSGLFLTCCDDTVPDDLWWANAVPMFEQGFSPVCRYYRPNGEPDVPGTDDLPHGTPMAWTRFFLLSAEVYELCGPFIDATWYSDIDYSERLTEAGRPMRACDGFRVTHLNVDRSWRTDEVDARERAAYEQAQRERAGLRAVGGVA